MRRITPFAYALAFCLGVLLGPAWEANAQPLPDDHPVVAQADGAVSAPAIAAPSAALDTDDEPAPLAKPSVLNVAPEGAVLVLARNDGDGGTKLGLGPVRGILEPPEPPDGAFDPIPSAIPAVDDPVPAAAPPSAAYQPNDPAAPAPNGVQVSAAGKQALDAVIAAVKSDSSGRLLAIMAAVSAGLWFLILLLRRFGGTLVSGGAVRAFTIFGGAVAAICGYFGAGLPWPEALQLFLAGPGALAFNEVVRIMGDPSQPKRA